MEKRNAFIKLLRVRETKTKNFFVRPLKMKLENNLCPRIKDLNHLFWTLHETYRFRYNAVYRGCLLSLPPPQFLPFGKMLSNCGGYTKVTKQPR